MTTITLPPLPSHPESMVFAWSPLEQRAIQVYALEVARVVLEGAVVAGFNACMDVTDAVRVRETLCALDVKHDDPEIQRNN